MKDTSGIFMAFILYYWFITFLKYELIEKYNESYEATPIIGKEYHIGSVGS